MSSNVGNSHNDDDQKQASKDEVDTRFHEGQANAHKANDSKDERTIANKLAREEKRQQEGEEDTPEIAALKEDPTAPARMHGNKPSRGAVIDAQLQAEEQAELERKGKA